MSNKKVLTQSGLKKYEQELHELKVVRRQEVAKKIKIAREQGDLSENADYDAAKDEQSEIENRIVELEEIIKNAEVIIDEDVDPTKINVGSAVRLLDTEFNEEVTYEIVGTTEANCIKNKISNESPVGAALIGHKAGEKVEVRMPSGYSDVYEILEVKKSN